MQSLKMHGTVKPVLDLKSVLSHRFNYEQNRSAPSRALLIESPANYGWILHPVLDLLFCCGGIVWLLFACHYFAFGPESNFKPVQIMVSLASLAAIGLSETHVIATLERLGREKSKAKFKAVSLIGSIACAILAFLGCFYPILIPIYLKLYLLLVTQHFTAQTYGIALLYCAKRGYKMVAAQKNTLAFLMQAVMASAIIKQLTYSQWSGHQLLGYKIPFWGPLPDWIFHASEIAVAFFLIAFFCQAAFKFHKERLVFPLPAALVILTGVLIFTLGKEMTGTLWIYVPAFFHASQYLAVSIALYLKERGLPEGISSSQIATFLTEAPACQYYLKLLLAALIFFQLIPYLAGLAGFDSMAVAAAFFAAIHFHHFLSDRAIWKLKDPELSRLLVA